MFDVIYATILVIRSLNCNILEISVPSRIQSKLNRNYPVIEKSHWCFNFYVNPSLVLILLDLHLYM